MDRIRVIMMAVTAMFCMTVTAQNQNSLTESECWLDNDVSTKQSLTSTETSIDISNLLNGLHSLTVRVKEQCGEQTITNNIRHQYGGPQPRSSLIHPKSTR